MSKKQFKETRIDADALRGMSRRCESYRIIDGTKMRERCLHTVDHREKHAGPSGSEWL